MAIRSQEEGGVKKNGKKTMISEELFQELLAVLTHSPPAADLAGEFDTLARRIVQFCYDPGADLTFEAWYRRQDDIFTVDAKSLDEFTTRVCLLLLENNAAFHEKEVRRRHQHPYYLFGPKQSLFNTRYTCTKLNKDPRDDFTTTQDESIGNAPNSS
ncbi:hypothetical protein ANCDUO_15479 [Ancylostoma duodenale]|uniref:DUF7083 domain-containing protein n=1 Tax=Ancylostoma duodenale TaxID=51022 RepID=A0A0C2GBQ2_9BILA|nr:hypothetical protein ANCDUO_15479 [Ancylostoma duodenale]